jgi:hypothetical protein
MLLLRDFHGPVEHGMDAVEHGVGELTSELRVFVNPPFFF